jgi:hypothetical protein
MGQVAWAVLNLRHLAMGLQGDKNFRGLIFSTTERVCARTGDRPDMLLKYGVLQRCNKS